MDKSLKKYDQYIKAEIGKLNKQKDDLSRIAINKRARDLLNYHDHSVRNFQHERFIHLIVTFFFAGLLIFSICGLFIPKDLSFLYLDNLLMAIIAILFVVEIFYVRHYFYLENGTEKLYTYSKHIFEFIE